MGTSVLTACHVIYIWQQSAKLASVWGCLLITLTTNFLTASCMAGCVLRPLCVRRGFIGAIGFTPMDFILPQFLWIAAYKPKGPK